MRDPISRLKKRQRVRGQVRLNVGGNDFSSILEMKLRFEIGQKLLRSSVDRDGSLDQWIEMFFLEEAGQELV